jgi:hypothetical protein
MNSNGVMRLKPLPDKCTHTNQTVSPKDALTPHAYGSGAETGALAALPCGPKN